MTPEEIASDRKHLRTIVPNFKGRCNLVLGKSENETLAHAYQTMLDQGKHIQKPDNPSGITIVFQDATLLGNNSTDRTKNLLDLLIPTGIAVTKEKKATNNMVLLAGKGYTDEDALNLQKEIEPAVMFYKNPAEIKVDQEGHLSIQPQNPPEGIDTPSEGTQETKGNQKTLQQFFSVAYPNNGILTYEHLILNIPSSADITQAEELTRELRIHEKIVELSKEELNKKLGGPEKAKKMLQEFEDLEVQVEKIPILKSVKMGRSLADFKKGVEEEMNIAKENNSSDLNKLLPIAEKFNELTNSPYAKNG